MTLGSKGLGTLIDTEKREVIDHPTIAVTPHRLCLGAVGADIWVLPERKVRDASAEINLSLIKRVLIGLPGYQTACD